MLPYARSIAFRSEAIDLGNPHEVVSPHPKLLARIGSYATDRLGETGDTRAASRIQKLVRPWLMADTTTGSTTRPLILTEELILMLLNEQNGYFHQVPGWELNCAVIGAVLAELSLLSRIDTDMESLHLVDPTATGNPALDPILNRIANEPVQRNAQFWIERLAVQAESVIDLTLDVSVRPGGDG